MGLRFQGTLAIEAPRERVWAFLTDPHAVSACLPDVQSLEVPAEGAFRAVVRVGVGFIKGNFAFDVSMQSLDPPSRATIRGHGGGMGSGVDVESTIALGDTPAGGTLMDWTADVVVSGPIASVGARLLSGTVEKKTAELFDCIRTRLAAPQPAGG